MSGKDFATFYPGPAANRVYFEVSTAEGGATLGINHVPARMRLALPVHPHDCTPDASLLLEPAFAHYVRQWKKIMPEDPEQKDALGFFVEASDMPDRIADPTQADQLSNIVTASVTTEMRQFFRGMLPLHTLVWGNAWYLGNEADFCKSAHAIGIVPYA